MTASTNRTLNIGATGPFGVSEILSVQQSSITRDQIAQFIVTIGPNGATNREIVHLFA